MNTQPPIVPERPGISAATLEAAGIRFGDHPEPGSIEIPYHDTQGRPTKFCRYRLPKERAGGQKYHQAPGSGTRAYIPPKLGAMATGGDLVVVEGEFKALSLIDHGIKAIGLPSFGTYVTGHECKQRLLDGIAEAIAAAKPDRILFLGDSDTATNYEFSRNAMFLANAVAPIPVVLPRIPVNGPGKGIDDCRGKLGDQFSAFWDELVETAEAIDLKAGPGSLALRLLQRESAAIKGLAGIECDKVKRRVVAMALACKKDPISYGGIKSFAEKVLKISRSDFGQAVDDAESENRRKVVERRSGADAPIPRAPSSEAQLDAVSLDEDPERGQMGQLFPTPSQHFAKLHPALVEEYGSPIQEKELESGEIAAMDISEDFFAATMGPKGCPGAPMVFVEKEDRFFKYREENGIYIHQREAVIASELSATLLECARECKEGCDTRSLEFRLRDAGNLAGVIRKAKGILAVTPDYFTNELTEYIPCANGMLRLENRELLPFSPTYRRRNKLAVPFVPGATCPRFLDELMRPALDSDDLDLLQRWCGLALMGENVAQVIMLLTGTAGGGKGTFIRVLMGVIGQINMGTLRPALLNDRFEMGRLYGKTLLYGPDVPENFLNQKGASALKSLTGGDPSNVEFKNSNETPDLVCKFNVICTSNSRLTVHLEGDHEAWRRRLRIVVYNKPKTNKVIPDFDKIILRDEGAGVLNWMLDGLDKARADGWQLNQTSSQQAMVDNLLLESDSCAVFVREQLRREPSGSLLLSDCFEEYVKFCTSRSWSPLTKNKFGNVVSEAIVRRFGITQRNNIPDRHGKHQRGWSGVGCVFPNSVESTGENLSHLSQNGQTQKVWDKEDSFSEVESQENGIPPISSTETMASPPLKPVHTLSASDVADVLKDFPKPSRVVGQNREVRVSG